ncbi:MAG: hypothetical protein JW984_16470 [Deltaproteobacteria bacterium]|uniref:Glycoside hydrolase family 38 N-terminal domain-containing protein n=1 Tax=Candidatus Zymogenus saltonus TaxID=2844893 RepID=A0A9D8KI25_9DELT|nr:hypothetical protein [Candidatus Zymogenus saltonus]
MSLFERAREILTSERMPPLVLRAVARAAVGVIGLKMRLSDRREARREPGAKPPKGRLYLVDGYHGGVVFWDWLGIRGGGLWSVYNWPLCLRPPIERAICDDRFKVVLDLDAYTYEWMGREYPKGAGLIRRGIGTGRVELVNGTYAQPFAAAESGESFLRQIELGTGEIRSALGCDVTTFYSQEPSCFPQLPQILTAFGYKRAVFRTQWASFGTDPGHDAEMVSWLSPDGSGIPTIPRYKFQNYERQLKDHPGLAAGSLSMGDDIPDWAPESLAPFEKEARRRGIISPLVADLKDVNIPEAPLPRGVEMAKMENVSFTTVSEYARSADPPAESIFHDLDDIPCTLPWGLEAEGVPRAAAAAESALIVGERLDAAARFFGYSSQEARLIDAWKSFCLAQHHDLYVCGPWHSRAHGTSMSTVAIDYAKSARDTAEAVAREALSRLSSRPGGDVIVFNPAGNKRFDYVEVSVPRKALPSTPNSVALTDGLLEYPCQPCQVAAEDGESVRLGALVHAPSLGIVHLKLIPASDSKGKDRFREANGKIGLKLDVSPEGRVSLINGNGGVVIEGPFLTCGRDGRAHDSRDSASNVKWVADGPVFSRIEVEGSVAGLSFIQTLTEYRGTGRIAGRVGIDFGEEGAYLGPQIEDDEPGRACSVQDERKLCLALKSSKKRMWCASPFWIGEIKGERAASASWVGIEDGDGRGLALINRGTRGYYLDRNTGVFRNVLAWGPKEWIYASDDSITRGRSKYTMLRGKETFRYAIAPYASREEAEIAAAEVRLPLLAIFRGGGQDEERGELPPPFSALSVSPKSVIITAFLVRGGEIYARLWNGSDGKVEAEIVTAEGGPVYSAPLGLGVGGEELTGSRLTIPPWGIRAVRIGEETK